jgi:activator of HSP90 ATPase
MEKTIQQSMTFPVKASKLYALYADSKLHTAATGQKASIGRAAGGRFSAFDGMITGKLLHMARSKMIVQTWRGKHWKRGDGDSVLILKFEDTPKGGQVNLVHVNVPAHDQKGVTDGWRKFYWDPWGKYVSNAGKPAKKGARKSPRRKGRAKAARKPARAAAGRRGGARRAARRGGR